MCLVHHMANADPLLSNFLYDPSSMIDVTYIAITKPIGIKDVSHSFMSYCIDELIMNT